MVDGMMPDCLISFGSNIGNSAEYFREAGRRLSEVAAHETLIASDPISTRPAGGPPGQSDFLNGSFRLQASLSIENLFRIIRQIESDFGRERRVRWGARTIDLDILLFGDLELLSDQLTIPHPRMSFRRFVLQPASQIAAEMMHVTSGRSIGQLLEHLETKPDRITLVSSSAPKLVRIAHDLRLLCESAGWEFENISSFESFELASEKTKLLVFSHESQRDLRRLAQFFPGPTLDLRDADEKQAMFEVQAAIEAMKVL